jgi:NAD(P)-dependent dehydrogenase (short-subunit alcohol dehydrogenase family)
LGILDGKVAIVTGAGRGVGRGEALELAAAGASVVVNDVGSQLQGGGNDRRPADEVVELIRAEGGTASANYDDVADWEGAMNLVDSTVATFGGLDILVNNAGILRDKMIFSMEEDDWDSVIRVHLKGTFAPTRHACAYWRNRSKQGEVNRAAIVNTVSGAGLRGNRSQANYGSAKAAIAGLTVITSLEMARYGVRCNAISPAGITRISGTISAAEVKQPNEYAGYDKNNPQNSAPTVAWLASDEALHVTGQVFRAIGPTIWQYHGWELGRSVTSSDGEKWHPADIGPAINAHIFGSRAVGLEIPRSAAGTGAPS